MIDPTTLRLLKAAERLRVQAAELRVLGQDGAADDLEDEADRIESANGEGDRE